jgi:hypothetical protein
LALALARLDAAWLSDDPALAGRSLKSFVMQQLGRQVDAIGGVRTKLAVRPAVADARHLVWLRDQLGDRFVAGFVTHAGADSYELADRIWALPITDL